MFKSAKWRNEKNKIKCVFKLQFHGTQLALLGTDALMISLVPADVGKPTSRLEKAKVQDGSCYWEKPLYETVKFSQDPKTGKFHEKIYHFVVTKDASRFGGIGVVSIDFASYAEATTISSLSLPLKNANSAAVLHVSIEKLQGTSVQRDIDVIGNVNRYDERRITEVSLRTHFINDDKRRISEGYGTCNGVNGDHQASVGSNVMLSSSDSSSGLDTLHEDEPKNPKLTHESSITKDKFLQWNGSPPRLSINDSSTNTLGETSEESPYTMIQNLKVKVAALTRQADVSVLELQTLHKKIMNEMKRGQVISREVATLKEERNALKEECEKLKTEEVKVNVNGMSLIDQGDPYALLDELRQELVHEKDLSSNLRLQLQETQKSNAELALALEMSKSELICSKSEKDNDEEQRELEAIVSEHSGVKKTYLLEQKIIHLYGEIDYIKKDKDDLEMQMEQMTLDYEIIKQQNQEITLKLEGSQLQEQLKMQYECMSYSAVEELETEIESLENELKSKSNELSKSNLVIKELESHIKNLEEELENQGHEFETDLAELMLAKTNQEKRAIRADDNLRKMRLQNANAATRLQEELRRLSQKMTSTFEFNEKAAMKAMDEADKLCVEKRVLEDTLMKVKMDLQDLGDRFQEKLVGLEDQVSLKSKQLRKVKKKIEFMTKIHNNEIQRLKKLARDCSENLFLHKEKDLELVIEELERKLDVLVQKTDKSQLLSDPQCQKSNPQ